MGTAWFIGAFVARLVGGLVMQRLGERIALLASLGGLFVGALFCPFCHAVGPCWRCDSSTACSSAWPPL